jgi:Bacterial DNA-binding protein
MVLIRRVPRLAASSPDRDQPSTHRIVASAFADPLARNPRTGATIEVAGYRQPKFKAGKGLKEAVN